MARLTYRQETQIRDAVKAYLENWGMTSLRIVAAYVKDETGIDVAVTTVARLAREYGYEYKPQPGWEKVEDEEE